MGKGTGQEQKGFTLIEVVTSLAILGFIIIAFVNLFGGSLSNIMTMGAKDQAMSQAAGLMESVYRGQGSHGFSSKGDIEAIIGTDAHKIGEGEDLFTFEVGKDIKYDLEEIPHSDGVQGFRMTVTVFYQGGNRQATLTSFFRKGAGDNGS